MLQKIIVSAFQGVFGKKVRFQCWGGVTRGGVTELHRSIMNVQSCKTSEHLGLAIRIINTHHSSLRQVFLDPKIWRYASEWIVIDQSQAATKNLLDKCFKALKFNDITRSSDNISICVVLNSFLGTVMMAGALLHLVPLIPLLLVRY